MPPSSQALASYGGNEGSRQRNCRSGVRSGASIARGKSPQKSAVGFVLKQCRRLYNCPVKTFEHRRGIPSVSGGKANSSTTITSRKSVKLHFSMGQTKTPFNTDHSNKQPTLQGWFVYFKPTWNAAVVTVTPPTFPPQLCCYFHLFHETFRPFSRMPYTHALHGTSIICLLSQLHLELQRQMTGTLSSLKRTVLFSVGLTYFPSCSFQRSNPSPHDAVPQPKASETSCL